MKKVICPVCMKVSYTAAPDKIRCPYCKKKVKVIKKEEKMNPYRSEEETVWDAFIVIGGIVAAAIIVVIALVLR